MSRGKPSRYRRTAVCPVCGQRLTPQGLAGHMVFYHGERGVNVRADGNGEGATTVKAGSSMASAAQRARNVFGMVNQLKELKAERERLQAENQAKPSLESDDLIEALMHRELELHNELRRIDGRRPVVWLRVGPSILGDFLGTEHVRFELLEVPEGEASVESEDGTGAPGAPDEGSWL